MTSNVRLENLWRRLSLSDDASVWHARLLSCYAEPQRVYHTLQHLEECLYILDEAKDAGLIAKPDLIEMALWFHDAVYDPQGHENEELSAQMALEALGDHPAAQEVARLILLTQSHRPGDGPDDAWIIDIDLAIFAQPMERVLEYERQILAEYAWVPQAVYAEKRAEILCSFFGRERLYFTAWFQERFESQARENLKALICFIENSGP